MPSSVLLLGATGLVGGHALQHILAGDRYRHVHVLSRRPLPDLATDPRVQVHVVDFDRPVTYQAALEVDHVWCALGTTIKKAGTREQFYRVDYIYPYTIARAALRQGATHLLVVSAQGADPEAWTFYSRVKGQLETALRDLRYPQLSLFRPSVLDGDRDEVRPGELVLRTLLRRAPLRYRTVAAEAVARTMHHAAHRADPGVRVYTSEEIQRIGTWGDAPVATP